MWLDLELEGSEEERPVEKEEEIGRGLTGHVKKFGVDEPDDGPDR